MKQANNLISVLREANQASKPKLIQMAEDSRGRSHGGRSGYKDDHRDQYSGGGRKDFSSYRDRDSDRGYGSGVMTGVMVVDQRYRVKTMEAAMTKVTIAAVAMVMAMVAMDRLATIQ
ncbi:hypothetical protein QQF64_028882 [Cirrhinus molitorella]|uniref:Uncharacterized protein n=1 Tax=Cirrhinus molitorella TaxID=172907 RepID=A0ABR3N7X0_9TELE